jgi:AcrR family transcriptional regulator
MRTISAPPSPPSWPVDARGRLLATMAIVASERGYAATRVSDVLERTGVSRRTFYVHFADRNACFFAAYDAIVEDLGRLIDPAEVPKASENLDGPVALVLRRVLEHFATWPAHAQVLLVEVQSAGPSGIARHERTMAMLAAHLACCPQWQPGRCSSLERHEVAQALIGAMLRMVQLRLSTGDGSALPELVPSLTTLTTRVGLAA